MNQTLKNLGPNISILGTQWGDEGKGKIVDGLSSYFDVIARSTGGANAGHTIYTEGKKYVFHLMPSGLLHPETTGVIGAGCVIDLPALLAEILQLESSGLEVQSRVKISLGAHVIFGYHKKIDEALEIQKGKNKIGTTGRGIGPAYDDKITRIGIRVEDLLDQELFGEKIRQNIEFHSKMHGIEIDAEAEISEALSAFAQLKNMFTDVSFYLYQAMKSGKKILFEGAQAHHLDIDHGTYPFVTSASVSIGGVCTGLGVPPKKIHTIIGIAKAYTTRVGSGPFPTELNDEMGEMLREKGGEFGATTGRPRRCGWFDAVMVRSAVQINGIDMINLTKLDVLTGVPELKVAIKYKLEGQEIYSIPTNPKNKKRLEIEYITCPGWTEDISAARKFEDLPAAAQNYVKTLQEHIDCKIGVIGVGMDRNDMVWD